MTRYLLSRVTAAPHDEFRSFYGPHPIKVSHPCCSVRDIPSQGQSYAAAAAVVVVTYTDI